MTWYKDYSQLFSSCVVMYDGSLTSDGKLANLADSAINGDIIGSPSQVANKFGLTKAIATTTGSQYIKTNITPNYAAGTLVIIYKPYSNDQGIMMMGVYDGTRYIQLYQRTDSNPDRVELYIDNGTYTQIYRNNLPDTSNWVFLAVSWSATICKMYYNDETPITGTGRSMTSLTQPIAIGAQNSNGTYNSITNMTHHTSLIFNRQVTDAEIVGLRQLLLSRPITPIIPNAEGRLIV